MSDQIKVGKYTRSIEGNIFVIERFSTFFNKNIDGDYHRGVVMFTFESMRYTKEFKSESIDELIVLMKQYLIETCVTENN